MRSPPSLADRFIEVMALLNAIEPDTDEPMRYQMRAAKRLAESIMDEAMRSAGELARHALDLQKECKVAVKEAVDAALLSHNIEA